MRISTTLIVVWLALTFLALGSQAGTFVNVSSSIPGLSQGKAGWADYDADGFVDIHSRGFLWRNNGGSNFSLAHSDLGEVGVWGDANNDGWPDFLSYAGPGNNGPTLFQNNAGSGFSTVTLPALPELASRGASWADHDNDGDLDLYLGGFESRDSSVYYPDVILRNNGGMSFSHTWTQPTPRPGRGITSADFDQDGDTDIYVSNYRLEPNELRVNDGAGNFSSMASSYNATGGNGHTIGSSWGDFDNDGEIDLFVGNFAHDANYFGDGSPRQPESRFLRNRGPAQGYTFEDMGQSGVDWQESYASTTLGDYDNDGDVDLFITTVYPGDTARLYRNDGNWNFTDVTSAVGLSGLQDTTQAGFADYDNDGDLDLLTDGKLFRNGGNGNHWLKLKLVGDGQVSSLDAAGAQVRIGLGSKTLVRQVELGTGEGNQNDPTLHFGLGSATGLVDLEILWPGGGTTQVTGVAVNQMHTIPFAVPLQAYQWVPSGFSSWHTSTSWSPSGVPNASHAVAELTTSTAPATIIQVNATATVHRLEINGDSSYRVIGSGRLHLAGAEDTGGVVVTGGDHRLAVDFQAEVDTTLSIAEGASLTMPAVFSFGAVTVTKAGEGTLYVNGPAEPGLGLLEVTGGRIAGEGTLGGDLVMTAGTVAPGHEVGRFDIAGDLTLGGSAVLEMEIGGPASDELDFLNIEGTASLAGSLEVVLAGGLSAGGGKGDF